MNLYVLIMLAEQAGSGFKFEEWAWGIIAALVTAAILGLIKINSVVQSIPKQLKTLGESIAKLDEKMEATTERVNYIDRDVAILKDWRERADRNCVRDAN